MKTQNKNLMTLEEFKEKNYGKRGTKECDELEPGYEVFKIGALIHDIRLEMGMTQEQLAEKVGTTKPYLVYGVEYSDSFYNPIPTNRKSKFE